MLLVVSFAPVGGLAKVLIVADEFPAMQVVAEKLKREENLESTIVSQKELPSTLTPYTAVVVYIHGALAEQAENAFIAYTKAGGKLVLLHHSISSGKRKNARWFPFLGISLPVGELAQGGYKWIEGISFELFNLQPNHFIMTNKLVYPEQISRATPDGTPSAQKLAGFRLENTEVYLNHVHTEPRTLLMGLRHVDKKSGRYYVQESAGWIKPAGQGHIIYFMPGHMKEDFENVTYGRIVLNAIIYKHADSR
jgi:hypothetical protein